MHIAGIVESSNTQDILDIIKYFLNLENRKVSISEYGYRFRSKETWSSYCSAISQTGTEILIIKIKTADIEEALTFLPIDTIIVNDHNEWNLVSDIIRNGSKSYKNLTVILNSDVIKISDFTDEQLCRILCYGFSKDSNITTSSTGEPSISSQFLCYIRNRLVTADGKRLEPQEYVINLEDAGRDPYNILAAASFAVLHDVNLNRADENLGMPGSADKDGRYC
ncbi:MAG: hypothetical protein GXZ01_12225 [Clostridiaceae bacterium]|nr:hypothetical protein [Clostridiaceae bacterium]